MGWHISFGSGLYKTMQYGVSPTERMIQVKTYLKLCCSRLPVVLTLRGITWDGTSVLVAGLSQTMQYGVSPTERMIQVKTYLKLCCSRLPVVLTLTGITWDGTSVLVLDSHKRCSMGFHQRSV